MKKEIAEKIIVDMEKGYDSIADKFSETRKFFWRDLAFIGDYAKAGDKVFDYGSGNGRILELFSAKPIEFTGADVSQNLVNIAAKKFMGNLKFVKIAGCASLPFPDNYFNVAYSIAVFHHLPGAEMRLKMAKELYRILQPGGRVVVAVWNLWQKEYFKNIIRNWKNKILGGCLSPHQFSNEFLNILFLNNLRRHLKKRIFGDNWCGDMVDWNDCYISFQDNQGTIFNRYHRAFTRKELQNIFSQAGFTIERSEIIKDKTIFLVGKK